MAVLSFSALFSKLLSGSGSFWSISSLSYIAYKGAGIILHHLALHCIWHLQGLSPKIAIERFCLAIIIIFCSQICSLLLGIIYAPVPKKKSWFWRPYSVCFEQPHIPLHQLIKRKCWILMVKRSWTTDWSCHFFKNSIHKLQKAKILVVVGVRRKLHNSRETSFSKGANCRWL